MTFQSSVPPIAPAPMSTTPARRHRIRRARVTDEPEPVIRGRSGELAALDVLLSDVRASQSRVLVIHGEAGIGKTVLLDHLASRANGCRVVRATGVESEMELAFAGLHQLCAPFLDHLARLPTPQTNALSSAFGLAAGNAPDRFLVGLAVLSLLTDIADEQPLVCLIDDAQWLDRVSTQTLAFVARRLLADQVAIVFAVRELSDDDDLFGLPELPIARLHDADARDLLKTAIQGPLDIAVRDRIVAETHGNPLALLELPRGLTPVELAGGFGLPEAMPMTGRLEQGFMRRLQPLPAPTRQLLLAAAVEPVGDVGLLWRAATHLGIEPDAAAEAQAAGLFEIGSQVRFRHPLVRSAVCRAAGARDLQEVHRALAAVTDPQGSPDRRAWHLAQSSPGPDEDIATELERSAGRARTRGGLAAEAAFLERAAELTIEPAHHARRSLSAAQAKHHAGAFDAALALLSAAEAGPLDDLARARTQILRGQIAFASRRSGAAPALLLAAAKKVGELDPELARDTYLDALSGALVGARLARAVETVAVAAQDAPPAPQPPRFPDLVLDGLSLLITDGHARATPLLRQALQEFDNSDRSTELRWRWLAGRVAATLWDDDAWRDLTGRQVQLTRAAGALSELPLALNTHLFARLFSGEMTAAAALAADADAVTSATGSNFAPYGALGLAAWRGDEPKVSTMIATILADVEPRGEGVGVTVAHWAEAVLSNALGRYQQAFTAAEQACAYPAELGHATWTLAELIEAGARSGHLERAHSALDHLAQTTQAAGTDWALGVEARCRALLSDGAPAEALYREAIERLAGTKMRAELARAHLVYGEWLRRENRRLDARQQLRAAHEMFDAMGAQAFAERTRRELLATGETVRARTVDTFDELTAQEAQIARLAAQGRTNPEIGAELFISSRTVEWHLRKVYPKLGISTRKGLRDVLPALASAAATN